MVGKISQETSHTIKRSDLLTCSLALLGIGMPMLLGPEWGWPFLITGLAGVSLYFLLWRSKNPRWLNAALWSILALFVVTGIVVKGRRMLGPIPKISARYKVAAPPSKSDLSADYERLRSTHIAATKPHGPSVGIVHQGDCGVLQVGGVGNTATGGNCTTLPKVTIAVADTEDNYQVGNQFISNHNVLINGGVVPKLSVNVRAKSLLAISLEQQPLGLWTTAPVVNGETASLVNNASGHLILRVSVTNPADDISFKFTCEGAECSTVYSAAPK